MSTITDTKQRLLKMQRGKLDLPTIGAIIAIASGKGGVGKSTVAVNVARALKEKGLRVGIVDADIYGPSLPIALGLQGQRLQINADNKMIPLMAEDMPVQSIGFLVEQEKAIIWRGPLVMGAIEQLFRDTLWPELDVLITDLPPGTGDAQLTMAQRIPLTGAIIVSTPQDLALADAKKGLQMFQTVQVPIMGIVENMSYFECPVCATRTNIFGCEGVKITAEKYNVPLLAEIPLHIEVRTAMDAGKDLPLQYKKPFQKIAEAIEKKLMVEGRLR